jgi:hypothetical protein
MSELMQMLVFQSYRILGDEDCTTLDFTWLPETIFIV